VLTRNQNAHLLANFPPICVEFSCNTQVLLQKFALLDEKFAQNLNISSRVNTI